MEGDYTLDIPVTPYDSFNTLLHKYAHSQEIPVRLIVIRTAKKKDYTLATNGEPIFIYDSLVFENLRDYLLRKRPFEPELRRKTGNQIVEKVKLLSKNEIRADDLVFTYMALIIGAIVNSTPDFTGFTKDDEELILNEINAFYQEIEEQDVLYFRYTDFQTLLIQFDIYSAGIGNELDQDEAKYSLIEQIQEKLKKLDTRKEKILISPVELTSATVAFHPTFRGSTDPIRPEDGLEIFNSALVSPFIPYLRYNDPAGRAYTRVYTSSRHEDEPRYDVTIIPFEESSSPNFIYLTLWLGQIDLEDSLDGREGANLETTGRRDRSIGKAHRDTFYRVTYDLENNFLTVRSPLNKLSENLKSEQFAVNRTEAAFPTLNFGPSKDVSIGGDFFVYDFTYLEAVLLDMILNDTVLNTYLYIDESNKAYANKKRLDIRYRSIGSTEENTIKSSADVYISNLRSIVVTLKQTVMDRDETVSVMDYRLKQGKRLTLSRGTPYLKINIQEANARKTIESFMPIFTLLLMYYQEKSVSLANEYREIIPTVLEAETEVKRKKSKTRSRILSLTKKVIVPKLDPENENINKLQKMAPELFVTDYARQCQKAYQPSILLPEQLRAVLETQPDTAYLPYPALEPRFFFICNHPTRRFPGVKVNYTLSNAVTHPYIPCCYIRDQRESEKDRINYNTYLAGGRPDSLIKPAAKAASVVKTKIIIGIGTLGELPKAVETSLMEYSPDAVQMYRYGVQNNTRNAFLHAVSTALDDPIYLSMKTDLDREAYVTALRAYIATVIEPSLLRQELYDYTDEEILAALQDPDVFFDPKLFKRAVEEVYNINIYLFGSPNPNKNDTGEGKVIVPRFRVFHAYTKRLDRPTVVLLRTKGAVTDVLRHPHIELIIDYDGENKRLSKLFGPDMTNLCHQILTTCLKTLTVSNSDELTSDEVNPSEGPFIPSEVIPSEGPFTIHQNIYSYLDHLNLVGKAAVSQYIDQNGKMRLLTFVYSLGTSAPNRVTVATIPSQPENLPIDDQMYPVDLATALTIFGRPTGVSRTATDQINGLWFQVLDIKYGEYVQIYPVYPDDVSKDLAYVFDLTTGPTSPYRTGNTSVTRRLTLLHKTSSFIIQLVRWLYDLARLEGPVDPSLFVRTYFYVSRTTVYDTATVYDISRVPRKLPLVNTVSQGLAEISGFMPTLLVKVSEKTSSSRSGSRAGSPLRLKMYDEYFNDRIVKMLRDYHSFTYGLPSQPAKYINNYYSSEEDFIQYNDSKIFLTEQELQIWLTSLKMADRDITDFYEIHSRIEISMADLISPYIYQDPDTNKLYLIQNVKEGKFNRALAVTVNWFEYRINTGYQTDPVQILPNWVTYTLTETGLLVPSFDSRADKGETFVKIIYYGDRGRLLAKEKGAYAAMLEVL